MKEFKTKKNAFLFGAFLGAVSYLLIYGVRLLDVRYLDWLMSNQDLMQHYFGWAYYRYDDWRFPLGLAKNFGYPFGVPISYTDSIPLMAIFFKLLNPWLSQNFQYLGLWGFLCFILQGAFAALLLQRYTKHCLLTALGTLFFIFSPVMLARMYGHTALSSHWLLLCAINLWVYRRMFAMHHEDCWLWPILASLSVLIHPYFTAMIFVSLFFYAVDRYTCGIEKRLLAGMVGTSLFVTLFFFWVLGGFSAGLDKSTGMLGFYSMNLNAFFNPLGWSALLKDLPLATDGQGEGFQYLGAGGILLLILACYKKMTSKELVSQISFPMAGWIISCLLLAVGNYFTWNHIVLLHFSLPLWLEKLWGTFSSSGRLFWPVYYLLLLWIVKSFIQESEQRKRTAVFLLLLFCIQVIDLYPALSVRHNFYIRQQSYDSPFRSSFWTDIGKQKQHMMILPADRSKYGEISWYTTKWHLSLNTGNFARWSYGEIDHFAKQETEHIKNHQINRDTLYIISNMTTVFRDFFRQDVFFVDGYFVLGEPDFQENDYRGQLRSLRFTEQSIETYLDTVAKRQGRILLIAASDEASQSISEQALEGLRKLGLQADLKNKNRWSYAAVAFSGERAPVYEKSEQALIRETLEANTMIGKYRLTQRILIESAGNPYGNHAMISIGGVDYSPNERGLNMVLYNIAEQRVEEVAHFDTYEGSLGKVAIFQ